MGGGPQTLEKVAPRRMGAQNFALFLPIPVTVSQLSVSLWVSFSWNFEWMCQAPEPSECARLRSRVVVCEPRLPGLVGPPGFHTDSPRAQTCTLEGPGLQEHHPRSRREDQQEREKRIKIVAGEGSLKCDVLGDPAEARPVESSPAEGWPAEGGPAEAVRRRRSGGGSGGWSGGKRS